MIMMRILMLLALLVPAAMATSRSTDCKVKGACSSQRQVAAVIGDWGGAGGSGDPGVGPWTPGPKSCPTGLNTPFAISELPDPKQNSQGDEQCVKDICNFPDGSDQQENCIRTLQQRQAAYLYDQVCHKRGCDFVINTSDNFYMDGCNSTRGSWGLTCRGRFETAYKAVYQSCATPALKGLTWYGSLGNHDILGYKQGVEDQIAYTKEDSTWYLPARWYKKTIGSGPSAINLVVLHSSCFIDGYLAKDSQYSVLDEEQICGSDKMRKEQLDFAEAALAEYSKAPGWTFLVLHHPPFSGDESYFEEKGRTTNAESAAWARLADLVKKYKPVAVLNGHDHVLTHTYTEEYKDTNFIVSGAGSFTEPNDGGWNKTSNNVVADKPFLQYSNVQMHGGNSYVGFVVLEVDAEQFKADFYSANTGTKSQYTIQCSKSSSGLKCKRGAAEATPDYIIPTNYPSGIPGPAARR